MLTPLHFIYLAVIVVVIVLMIMKHDVVAPCILGIFILGTAFSGGVIGGAQVCSTVCCTPWATWEISCWSSP